MENKMSRLLAIVYVLAILAALSRAHAQEIISDDIPGNCGYADGEFYQPNLFPRYEPQHGRIALVDWTSAAVAREIALPESLVQIPLGFRARNWSPDCRFLTGLVAGSRRQPHLRETAIWDTLTGNLVSVEAGILAAWSPDSRQAIFYTRGDVAALGSRQTPIVAWAWDMASRQRIMLTERTVFQELGNPVRRIDAVWDHDRGQLIFHEQYERSSDLVRVYDLRTGAQIATYDNPPGQDLDADFALSDDGSKLIVFSVVAAHGVAGVTIWDRDNDANIQLDADNDGARSEAHIALSPNQRWLAIGRNFIRVWDLTQLPEALVDRDPLYRHDGPDRLVRELRFVDNDTLEVITVNGAQLWDVVTGELVQ